MGNSKRNVLILLALVVVLLLIWGISLQSVRVTSPIELIVTKKFVPKISYFNNYWDEWNEVISKNTGTIKIYLLVCWPYLQPFANPEAPTIEILPIPLSECPIDCEYVLKKEDNLDAIMFAPDNFGDLKQEKELFESNKTYKIVYDQESNSLKPFKLQFAEKLDLVAGYQYNSPVPISMVLYYDQDPTKFYKTPPNFLPFNERRGIACIITNQHSRGKISRLGLVDALMEHYPIDQWGMQRHNIDLPQDDVRKNQNYNSSFYPYTVRHGKILNAVDPIFKRGCRRLCRPEKN